LQWRESEGARLDRPVYKVLGNKVLLELARGMPEEKKDLLGIEGLPPRLIERFGKALLAAVARGKDLPEGDLPLFPRQPRKQKDPAREDRFRLLKKWREQEALKYALDPGVLINNYALEALALANPQSRAELDKVAGLKRWQKAELGAGLLGALA
jgi:ribonuclease D